MFQKAVKLELLESKSFGLYRLFIHSYIHYMNLYNASSRLLLRSAPDSSTAEKISYNARVECAWGTIAVPMEAHSKQRGLLPRMHEGRSVPPVPLRRELRPLLSGVG